MAGAKIPKNFSSFPFGKIEVKQNQIGLEKQTHFFSIFQVAGDSADSKATNLFGKMLMDCRDLGVIINDQYF